MSKLSAAEWKKEVIREEEIEKYLISGRDFIDEEQIKGELAGGRQPDKKQVRDIMQKSLAIERLEPAETAALLQVTDPSLWEEMRQTGLEIKRKVYDNRIVFFAPLYCSNLCVNNCAYCGFKCENNQEKRRILTMNEVRQETEAVISEGHKRLIMVYGEHQQSDVDYMIESIKTAYDVKKKSKNGWGNIRRINVNAAPMSIANLKKLREAGLGTYQVFQETYDRKTYGRVHPANTLKGNYRWRLYALHRAMDAGIDDVAVGALFGLHDWRFEVMGLLHHTMDLERQFGIGPHTISFPRLMPASDSPISKDSPYLVNDADFLKLVTVLRLSVPYTGMIVTARESAEMRRKAILCGCTQTDASTKIGIGGYTDALKKLEEFQETNQKEDEQQFMLGDTRSLDEVVRELAEMGMITSFCTAGYRCGRTGDKIMGMLKHCVEGKFCKLNAVLTYREFLEDYASAEMKKAGEKIIQKEIEEIQKQPYFQKNKELMNTFWREYEQIRKGERDIYI
ncbi:MAG: [FeFe] hydrogenase H-cluster radical SAM maturase HydG [Candidatus Cloacimonetes bacterium]|nr:[FeFe] hydrogenase H-cluster radical SAM maturase HydG [Candidatus Cloacimonadota bacterium]